MKSKLDRFINRVELGIFRCPICHSSFDLKNKAYVCEHNHTYNINKKGFLNIEPQKHLKHYNEKLFEARYQVINAGYFDKLINEINNILIEYNLRDKRIADIGCGEGSFLHKLDLDNSYGIDLSSAGIKTATTNYPDNNFIVADLANLPFIDNSLDVILNILTPANYEEFNRVLNKTGYLIKVIPQTNYLRELKELVGIEVKEDNLVLENLKKNHTIIKEVEVNYKIEVADEMIKSFIEMTPLMMNVEKKIFCEEFRRFPKVITIDFVVTLSKSID